MLRAVFLMEQHLGHRAFYQNLRQFAEEDSTIVSHWVPVTYTLPGSLWSRLPLLPEHWRGTLNGRAQVRKALAQNNHDIALFNTQVPAALAGTTVRKKPYVLCTDITPIQYDGMGEYYDHEPDRNGILARYKHRLNRRLFQDAAWVLPWSAWTADSLITDYGVSPERIEVIPPGVDLELWKPGERNNGGAVRILFVGGDLFRKGGEVLLEAFRHLAPGKAELILVTRTEMESSENIRVYHDMQPNTPRLIDLFRTCDIFVLPTRAEAFGIAAVEGSAVGMPVVGTSIGGLAEIVVDGETGFLISPDNAGLLADRLKRLIDDRDLRLRMGVAARERVETRFDARKNAARTIRKLIESVDQ